MVLTKRDLELLEALAHFGLFTTRQIAARYFKNARLTTVLRRLRKLEESFYIERQTGLDGGELAWSLKQKGAELIGSAIYKRRFRRDELLHDLKLTTLRLHLESQGVAHSWIPEHEIRSRVAQKHGLQAMQHRVVPDGIMGVEVNGCKESVAIELELSLKSQDRYRRTFRQYREKSSLWAVWYLVGNFAIGRQAERIWREVNLYRSDILFLWSVLGEVEAKTICAAVHGDGSGKEVVALFALNRKSGAHSPAQGVSTEESAPGESIEDLSTENKTEMLAPAN